MVLIFPTSGEEERTMAWLGRIVTLGIGAALGAALKPETKQKVRDAADALRHEVSDRVRAEAAKVKRFFEEEVFAAPTPATAPARNPAPAASGSNGPPASA